MAKVKICGIRLEREVEALNRTLPDFAGFVFAPSRRRVDINQARSLIRCLHSQILPVGVFVDEPLEAVLHAIDTCGLKVVQLHGSETSEFILALTERLPPGIEVWKALKASPDLVSQQAQFKDVCCRMLFDGSNPGSGDSFDYSLLPPDVSNDLLAGGLSLENVREAIQKTNPYAVDASSKLEVCDGFKDESLIRAFITRAKSTKA